MTKTELIAARFDWMSKMRAIDARCEFPRASEGSAVAHVPPTKELVEKFGAIAPWKIIGFFDVRSGEESAPAC